MKRISAAILVLLLFCLPSNSQNRSKLKLIENWKPGTSSGIMNDFSQEEFNRLREAGIFYIELGSGVFRDKTDSECSAWVADVKEKADAAGLKFWSFHLPFSRVYDISSANVTDREKMITECRRMMLLCKPLKIRKYVIHGSSEPIPGDERQVRINNCIASLRILTNEAKKVNARLALECLPRTCLGNTSDEIIMIVSSTGNSLEVCFDTNHLLKETPEEFASKTGKLITTLHISDYDAVDERHWLPGAGVINWTGVIDELAKAGYKGPFMFEASRRKPQPDGNPDPSKLTADELVASFATIKVNYRKSKE